MWDILNCREGLLTPIPLQYTKGHRVGAVLHYTTSHVWVCWVSVGTRAAEYKRDEMKRRGLRERARACAPAACDLKRRPDLGAAVRRKLKAVMYGCTLKQEKKGDRSCREWRLRWLIASRRRRGSRETQPSGKESLCASINRPEAIGD